MEKELRNKLLGLLANPVEEFNSEIDTAANWRELADELHTALDGNLIYAGGYYEALKRDSKHPKLTDRVGKTIKGDIETFITPYEQAQKTLPDYDPVDSF
jgi:hypothetical protein